MYSYDGHQVTHTAQRACPTPYVYIDPYHTVHPVFHMDGQCYIQSNGVFRATPTRTGSWYQENYVRVPCDRCFMHDSSGN